MTIKNLVGAANYKKMRGMIEQSFPDDKTVVTDAMVDTAFQVAKHEWGVAELQPLAIPRPPQPAKQPGNRHAYYEAEATHARTAAPGSLFTGHLPLVRFQLPNTGTTATCPKISTPAGEILPEDRLYPSVDVLWATYKDDPLLQSGRPARVDLITPPRLHGARFSAIAVYLCFTRPTDPAPTFFILESGLATGQPRMPFLGRTMTSVIVAQTQYLPTPFSRRNHYYRGTLEMRTDAPAEPYKLSIEVFNKRPPTDQYLRVTVRYHKRSEPLLTWPFALTVEAAARVSAIADTLGVPVNLDQRWFLRFVAATRLHQLFTIPPR